MQTHKVRSTLISKNPKTSYLNMKQKENLQATIYHYVTHYGKGYIGFGGTDNIRVLTCETHYILF